MDIQGLSPLTLEVFNAIKDSDLFSEYLLIGGTALSMQLQHRLSEDIDFCKWQDDPVIRNKEIDWPVIEKYLKKLGSVKTEILDLYQVNFVVRDVRLSFYSNPITTFREIIKGPGFGKIQLPTVESIGAMKLEVISRRNIYRDYYDIYSILRENLSLKELVLKAGRYSCHRMNTKMMLSIISDVSRFRKEENFSLLSPKYEVTSAEIRDYIRARIIEEFGTG
jgi:predicted nucleotidyltransferase component of viral defense system